MQTANSCFNKLCLTTTTVHVRLSVGANSRWRQWLLLTIENDSGRRETAPTKHYPASCIVHLASNISLRPPFPLGQAFAVKYYLFHN